MPLGFYGPSLGGPGQGLGTTKQQLQALGILPPDQPSGFTPPAAPLTGSPVGMGGDAAMPLPADAMPTPAQAKAATPGMGALINQALPALAQSDAARRAQPDAADTAQALKAASEADAPPTATGLYPQQQPPQAPQGLYGPQAAPPATTPAQAPPAPPTAPPGPPAAAPVPVANPPGFTPPTPMPGAPGQAPAPYQEASLRPMAPPTQPEAPQERQPPQAAGGKYAPDQITAALIKAGVPPDDAATLTAISGAESGYRPSAIGPKNRNGTTDYGLFQINSTHGDLNPATLPGADLDTQAQAAAAVYKKEGLGAWSTFNNGAYKGFLGGGSGVGGVPSSSPSGNLAAAQTAMQSPGAQASDVGINPDEIMNLATKLGYKPTDGMTGPGDKFISMGLGMLGGRTMADSFSNAGKAFQESRGQDIAMREHQNANALGIAQLGLSDARLGQQSRIESAKLLLAQQEANAPKALGTPFITGKDADGNPRWGQMTSDKLGHIQTIPTGDPLAAYKMERGNQLSTDKATTAAAIKDNTKEADGIDQAGEAASKQLTQLNNLIATASDPKSAAGPGALLAFKRDIATRFGIDLGADPSSVQLAQKLSSMGQAQAAQGMKGTGLRTEREFRVFISQAAGLDNDPSTITALTAPMRNSLNSDVQAYRDFHDPAKTDQVHLMTQTNGVRNFRSKYGLQTVDANIGPQGSAPQPTIEHTPTGWAPKPGAVLRYDDKGNIIQ